MSFVEQYGPWALVTGASSGIGEEFARQLAQKGLNLVLVARREERLQKLAGELAAKHGVETRVAVADLSAADFMSRIDPVIKELSIGLLVNSAGIMYINNYLDMSAGDELRLIDINVKAPAILSRRLAPDMVNRGRGGIIFVASILGYMGTPYSAAYAATKAYEIAVAEGLNFELRPRGVDVMVLCPGPTKTEMLSGMDMEKMPMKPMEPASVVAGALGDLGKKVRHIPGSVNKMMVWMNKRLMSRDMATTMMGRSMKASVGA